MRTLPFTDNIVLTTYGSDYTPTPEYPSVGGVGVLRIDEPAIVSGLMTVAPYGDDEFGYMPAENGFSDQPG